MELHFPFRFRNCLYYTQITFSQFTLEVTMAGIHVPGESSGSYRFRTEFSPPICPNTCKYRITARRIESDVAAKLSKRSIFGIDASVFYRKIRISIRMCTYYCLIVKEWRQ